MVQISSPSRPSDPGSRGYDKVLEKKREILLAASRVFRERGLHATGMRDIAAELKMAVGNLYYYFKDKETLLAFIQESTLSDLLDMAARVRELDLRPDQKIKLLLEEHVVRLNDPEEGTPGSLAHLEIEALSGALRTAVMGQRDEYELTLRRLIEEGMDRQVFRQVDAKVAALALLGAVNWTVKWFRPEGGKSAREIGREAAETLVGGLLVSPASPASPTSPNTEEKT
ncbi:MAG TPA: TetR/AcrR family transcriptional regulator [Thermoanaerobaculia bacterium]|jgi:AcrR family transcriptional regulator|nr:TetR/AcrR family transcriptional regulator [Thermoanaerobaculia bacterium]